MMSTWNWFGVEVVSEKIFFITLTSNPKYYLYNYDPKTRKRTWTEDPQECLTFDNRADIEEMVKRHFSDYDDFQISEACE